MRVITACRALSLLFFLLLPAVAVVAAVTATEPVPHRFSINTADQPPYSTLDDSGYYDRLVTTLLARNGVAVQINHLPSARSLANADLGLDDGEYGRIAGMSGQYPNLRMVGESLSEYHFVAFARNRTLKLDGWGDLRHYHVGYIRGWKIYQSRVGVARSVLLANSEEELFELLQRNRVDLILYEGVRGVAYLRRMAVVDIHQLEPSLAVRPMYLYLHARHKALIPQLERTLRAMKADGTYQAIFSTAPKSQ